VLHIRRRLGHHWAPPTHPMSRRMVHPVVMIIRSWQRHRHRCWLGWIVARVLVVSWRVRVWVLRRVRCCRGENVTVGRDFRLWGCWRWRWRVAPPAAEAPPAVNVVSAADVAHDEVLGWVGLFLFCFCLF
jgi:hypothetical protein